MPINQVRRCNTPGVFWATLGSELLLRHAATSDGGVTSSWELDTYSGFQSVHLYFNFTQGGIDQTFETAIVLFFLPAEGSSPVEYFLQSPGWACEITQIPFSTIPPSFPGWDPLSEMSKALETFVNVLHDVLDQWTSSLSTDFGLDEVAVYDDFGIATGNGAFVIDLPITRVAINVMLRWTSFGFEEAAQLTTPQTVFPEQVDRRSGPYLDIGPIQEQLQLLNRRELQIDVNGGRCTIQHFGPEDEE